MLSMLRADLHGRAATSARAQADVVARQVTNGKLGRLLPLGDGTDFIQVVDANGAVVAASQNVAGLPALSPLPQVKQLPGMGGAVEAVPGPDGGLVTPLTRWDLKVLGLEENQQVTSVAAMTPKGDEVVIHTGVSLVAADAAESTTALTLAVGCPLLLLLVAFVTWRVTGRALRPVEAIRTEVAAIGEQALHRRVPIPRGGDEIAKLATTMNAMLDRLDVAGQRQRQFIADASHELRSPIAVLRTQLEVALAHPDPDVRVELVEGALEDTERLQALATDLLFLARLSSSTGPGIGIGSGGVDRPGDPVDLGELVAATVRTRGTERCPVDLDLADEVVVPGNHLWLTRLVTNLLDNAQRHARSSVHIRVRLSAAEDEAVLEVRNDGAAIDPADRERIFERFTRLDDARSRDHGGAGLGLPIARDIAHHHGGTLAVVESEIDAEGATFQARLPL
ncbi:HAMP domain-containing protein [Streptacidiphilus sp. NEAU-YB345]|uniref:histidine kinase n=2 Tax=Streptacidiphilus fuscans TaxID=2789292 RepID=A0A931B444_9ACTN|nr:HAMP domain-containing protein [Streptacidiphilus fuscans]